MHSADIKCIRDGVGELFAETARNGSSSNGQAQIAWRLFCFDSGLDYVKYISENHFSITGRSVLDVACAWGGHALAFACGGANVVASDLKEHQFPPLVKFAKRQHLQASVTVANCEFLPFCDSIFDVVLALELIEHIDSVDGFAVELARVLRCGGICLVSTPARFRSLLQGEPHFGLRGLAALPVRWQRPVATALFGRSYPYPIRRQYVLASQVLRPFTRQGLKGFPVLKGRLAKYLHRTPVALKVAREVFWTFLVVMKPTQAVSPGTPKYEEMDVPH